MFLLSRLRIARVICGLLCLTVTVTAEAGKFNRKLSVGDKAPAWSELAGIDGERHSTKEVDSKFVIVIFTCNQCPVATAYQARFQQLVADYGGRDVSLIAINSHPGKGEMLVEMAQRAAEAELTFPYLKDETQAIAVAYGARTTPSIFLLDAERKIVYQGAM